MNNMNGEYFDLVKDQNGKSRYVSTRVDTDEIIDELKRSIDHKNKDIAYWESKYKEILSETYKYEELQRLKKELDELKKERYYGFEISQEENDKINAWKEDWFKRKRGGDKYMGAIGGGFTYKFHPTGIGTSCVVIAPDGEEFQFRELG